MLFMDIYEELEKCYLEFTPQARFDKFYNRINTILSFFAMIILLLRRILKPNWNYFTTFCLIIVFYFCTIAFCCFLFIIFDFEKRFPGKGFKHSLLDKIKAYLVGIEESTDVMPMIEVLRKNNVCTKQDLNFVRQYFLRKSFTYIKSDTLVEGITLAIAVAALLISGYDFTQEIFHGELFEIIFIAIGFVIIFLFFREMFRLLFKVNLEELNCEIEKRLTYIYLHFDIFFGIKSTKKSLIGKKLSKFLKK